MCYTTFLSHFDGLVKIYTILWITVILMAWSYRDWQEIGICWLEHVLLETGRWMWLKSNMSFTKLCYIFTQQGTSAGYGKQKNARNHDTVTHIHVHTDDYYRSLQRSKYIFEWKRI